MNKEDIIYEFKNIVEESRTEDRQDYYIKLRNVLDLIQELEEENKKLKESEAYLYDAYQDAGKKMFEYAEELEKSIPISVIQNKIDEIKEDDKKHKTYTSDGRENFTSRYLSIPVLEELLEERNK